MKSSSSYSIEDLKADPEADYSNQKLNNGQTGKDHASSNRESYSFRPFDSSNGESDDGAYVMLVTLCCSKF